MIVITVLMRRVINSLQQEILWKKLPCQFKVHKVEYTDNGKEFAVARAFHSNWVQKFLSFLKTKNLE